MTGLWDTTGNAVVKALAAERRTAGGVTSGLALTLIAVVDETQVRQAEAAATIAASSHPCRLLIVMRSDVTNSRSRLDAEIAVGGRLGPCEAVVMRMLGRLALHAESVVMPLLAPDVPVVTWWQGAPPDLIANDPLGVVADRRITDCSQATDPAAALRARAADYAPGDTDLTWTRVTPWRSYLASALDGWAGVPTAVTIVAPRHDPSSDLLAGWLTSRLGVRPTWKHEGADQLTSVRIDLSGNGVVELAREDLHAVLRRSGHPDRVLPLCPCPTGDDLAEELRRLDADLSYAEALSTVTGVTGLDERSPTRLHVWSDPSDDLGEAS